MSRKTYQLDVSREGRWWIVSVPEIDQVTQARTRDEIEVMGRDLIAIITEQDPDSFDLAVRIAAAEEADAE